MGKIQLEGLEFYAYHGYHEKERELGNRFTIDISIFTPFGEAAKSDELSGTVDYEGVYKIIARLMDEKYKLLEHLAYQINKAILADYKQINKVEVKVSKHSPPIGGECRFASITLASAR